MNMYIKLVYKLCI